MADIKGDKGDKGDAEAYIKAEEDVPRAKTATGASLADTEKGTPVTGPSSRDDEEDDALAGGRDANAVGWDGPDDPENPMNWTAKKKWVLIGTLSMMTLLVPLGSSMFAPGVPAIMREFDSENENIATFVVSVYVLGFAVGPLIAAPASETWGRAVVYNAGNVLFLVFTVATALSPSMETLILFRFLMGCAGSPPITNGSGTLADMLPVEERGRGMAIWAMGPMLGPCIGPIAGGFIVESIGWRWVYWVIAIAAAIGTVISYFVVTETYAPVLVGRKTRRLRASTGNPALYNALEGDAGSRLSHAARFRLAIVRPSKFLFTLPHFFILSLYVAVEYGILYLMFSTFTFVFQRQYGFSSGIVGLSYVPTGLGMMIGASLFGSLTDKMLKAKMARGETPVPEDRLPLGLSTASGLMVAAGLFWYGWATETNVHWIVPMLGVAVFCIGLMGVMLLVQMYLVDSYVRYAASVIAALTMLRSTIGAVLPLSGLSLYNALGWGWGNSVLAFVSLALAPVPLVFRYYGAGLRKRFPADF